MSVKSLNVINEIISPYRAETSADIADEVIKDYVSSFGFLEDLLHFSKTAFVIVEYESMSYLHVSSNTMEVFGWPTEKFKRGGPVLGLSCIHPDDLKIQREIHNIMLEFFDSIPNDDKSKYKFSFTSRFFHSNGEQMMMLQNNFFLKWNESGKPLIKLFTITDITSYKEDSTAVFYVTRLNDDGTNEVVLQRSFPGTNDITLSEREREIVGYVSSGLSASEIAMLLSISEHTVKVHKKNILKKMGCSNTAQMTALASLYGLTSPVRN